MEDLNIKDKKSELLNLWSDLFSVCRTLVTDLQSGKATLRGSLLRELNTFLRESARIIESLEEAEAKRKMEEAYSVDTAGDADGQEESSSGSAGVVPVPIQEEPLKVG